MGTRNLTCVVQDNQFRVAQYCQWDGYPSGQGKTALEALRKLKGKRKAAFMDNLAKCRFIKDDSEIKELYKKAGLKESKDGWMTMEESEKFEKAFPQLHRNMGAEVLNFIADQKGGKEIILSDHHEFAADSLFCEWAYVVDLDKGKLEVYKGFNTAPVDKKQRFADLKLDHSRGEKYYHVRLIKTYDLDDLPTSEKFVKDLESKDEEA
jgi:hypothetical protein